MAFYVIFYCLSSNERLKSNCSEPPAKSRVDPNRSGPTRRRGQDGRVGSGARQGVGPVGHSPEDLPCAEHHR